MVTKKKKRKSLSKTVRFEVFKRDAFKCQYCGKSAPEVMLEVDHIIPVAKGGSNEIFNLITSCRDCNAGKGSRKIDDSSILAKQRDQLEEIHERREQIKMMAEWRQSLANLREQQIDIVDNALSQRTGHRFNATGREGVRKLLSKYDVVFICECLNIAFDSYLRIGEDGRFVDDSVSEAIHKWGGICHYRAQEINDPELHELRHITNWFYKYGNAGSSKPKGLIFRVIKEARDAGYSLEEIWNMARSNRTLYQFACAAGVDY